MHMRLFIAAALLLPAPVLRAADPTADEAAAALRKAVTFFREKVAVHGGYVWRYSADLEKREGEGRVDLHTVWVQPPATPSVGTACVDAYELAGDAYLRDAARETAMCLVNGQLHSGGWDAGIYFDPEQRKRHAYRVDGKPSSRARNNTSLDDDKAQSALRMLIRYDKATGFKDEVVHEAALYALNSLLDAQFPNGGWPHVYKQSPIPGDYPVKPASYSPTGEYTRIKNYWDLYTLNDNLLPDVIETLWLAWQTYDDPRCQQAVLKAGDFLILAQMPEPQPGWAQQYDFDMRPAWARKFEPASITGGESRQIMNTLMDLYELTGQRKYLGPLPRAIAYYKRSLLPDGRLARFYELKTNKPLYFTRGYELTYSDADMPTHYAFKVDGNLDRLESRYKSLANAKWEPPKPPGSRVSRPSPQQVRRVIDAMDDRGAWVEDGRMKYFGGGDPTRRIIDPRTFADNVRTLARYVAASR